MTEPIAITPQSLVQSAKLSVSNSGQLIAADPRLYDLLGWPATELIGHRLAELVHRADLPKLGGPGHCSFQFPQLRCHIINSEHCFYSQFFYPQNLREPH